MDSLDENDVVITGVSGVFPKSDNVEEFAEKLFSKENLLSSVPYMPCKLGKISDLSKFDAEFFGFQPHRVNVMDPMARIILEKAYEAIVDSGNNPVTLKGKNCGVYVGIHFLETEILCYEKIQKGASLAISRSFNANRISYWLGVHGPSFTVDSACSSTLLALEMAYKAITRGECESALVGGCHVCLHPALLLHLLKVGALNPNGESRVFDEKAGGFCKAEAIGIFYLQKAKDAKRVYAKVINVRSNHDGSKPLFLSPHGPSQAKLLKMIYEESKIDLDSVSWIEAHATGTLVGDKQEVTAIDSVFKNRKNPLLIGSVKSNMGHAEAAAAVGSISKVLIAMETGFIPPNINISSVRKDIEAFAEERIKVVTDKTSWNGGIVGISGFGMGGANSHAILKSFTKEKVNGGAASDDLPRIVGVSGRTENAVEAFLNYLNKSSIDVELIALLHEIHSYDIPLHPYRAYIAMNKDKSFLKKKTQNLKTLSRPLWFAFSDFENDIKSTYEAFKDLEIFNKALVMCDDILKSLGGPSIFVELENNSTSCNTKPCNGFYAVIIQIALSTVITELNLSPDNIIGESFGGLVYAYIDGSVSLYEALKIAIYCSSNNEEFSRDELKSFLEQTIQSRSISSRWIVKDENISLIDHLVNCLFNSDYVEEAIDSIPKNAIVLNFSTNKFSISLKEKLKGESVLIDLLKDDECSLNDLITSLGELYLLGKNPHFQKLYPAVPFPVSRSTKMIAPLIKWKHTVNWPVAFSSFQERMLSGERKVSVSLDDKAYSFISGHEIDSTVLFPGTGYMVLAWETLALIHSKMYTDLSVVFENVRFHKAVVVPRSEPITFSIMVHKGNGNFEILENNQIICTGRMYVPTNARKEMLNVKWNVDSDDEIVMDELDFYRYILIRNYNYKDAFRRIKQINSEGTKASVTWNGNWVTYLDGMMQNLMLTSDIDSLTVPVHIEKLVIDTHRHEEILKSNPSELVAYMDKNMKIVECGGVQVRNCVLRPIPWKINNKIPLNQKNIFSPFTAPQEKKLSTKDAVQLFAQCFMDNVGQQTKNVAIFEVIDEDSNLSYSLLTPFLLNFIKEQLLFNAKLTVLVESNINLTKSGNGGYNIVIGKLPLGEKVNLVICTQALKNTKKLDLVMNSLTDDGFLLTRENSNSTYSIPNHLQECGNIQCNGERFILLRKKIKVNLNSLKVIKISNHSFDWIEELQEAMKIALYDRIILLSEKEPFSGIIGFYNSLRLERGTGNIRCYFLADNEIDSFSIEDEPFKSQLLKDLAINIYQNGTWGCYVKYAIDDLVQEKVQHAFAYRKSNGLKFSIQWYKGNIKGSNESQENLIQVFYASINTADVLLYKNRLATAAIVEDILKRDYALGMEFAGRSQSGKRYMGLRPYGCLSTLIERDYNDLYINEVPKNWSLEDAATVPLAYYTVIYAMILCGKLTHRNTILIHSAGSFIGQAAIHIAIYYNCNIFVTISSIDEKLFIKENFPYIADSKIAFNTDSSFEQMIYNETNGRGVDVILNSLPDDKLLQSVNCLARFGRFVQIKKSDLNSSTSYGSKLLAKNASLYSAILEDILNLPKNQKIELREAVDQHIQNGAVKPLARTTYCYSGIESAFEFASSSRNLGKCVIQIEPEEERFGKTQIKPKKAYPRVICDAEKTYIVCGGLGGMGMEVIQWLIVRGARKIIITSRSGITKGSQSFRIKQWKSLGAHIVISKADISEEDQTLELLDEANSLGDVAGIFNLAGVLRDKMFKNQNAENFQICAKAKFFGTCNLDKFSRLKCPLLEYFVVFSSVAAGHGNLGQTNYAMFNSAVERICENRKVHGLPALAIEWGAVGNVGMFVSFKDGNVDSSYAGNYMQPMRSCLEVLDYSMNQSCPVVTSCVMAEKATL